MSRKLPPSWEKKALLSLPLVQIPQDPKERVSGRQATGPGHRHTLTPLVPVAVSGVSRGG